MRFAQLGAATALVAAAQAFLLPPTITEADNDIISTLPFEDAVSIKDRVMQIDCPGCPVVLADINGRLHNAQVASVLSLNFSLSLNDNDQLLLNDVVIYPVTGPSMQLLIADQLVKSPANTFQYAASPRLGYILSIAHPATTSNNEQLHPVTVKIEILEVAEKFVHGIPPVLLKLLETPSGKLMIGDAEILPVPTGVGASNPTDSNKECTSILCKWRAVIADKLSKVKGGCAGKARPGAHGKHSSGVSVRPHGRPGSHGGHRPHHHHHKHGKVIRFFRSLVLHVFFPIMIGVVVGITTSLIGIIVGRLIVAVWRVLFRRGQRSQSRNVQREAVEGDEETKSFLDHQGPLPTYEKAPAYEEAVLEEKTSE